MSLNTYFSTGMGCMPASGPHQWLISAYQLSFMSKNIFNGIMPAIKAQFGGKFDPFFYFKYVIIEYILNQIWAQKTRL